MFYPWKLSQVHEIGFVLIDSNGVEVTGLGNTFTLEIRKPGGAFVASQGTKAEISDGWYSYTNVASEADTIGQVSIRVTGAGTEQQNLVAIVEELSVNAVEFTYTVTDSVTTDPIEGVQVWFATDANFSNVVWAGITDAFGVARDENDRKPFLDPGTYYIRLQKVGYSFTDDSEVVS